MYKTVQIPCFTKVFYVTAFGCSYDTRAFTLRLRERISTLTEAVEVWRFVNAKSGRFYKAAELTFETLARN